MKQDKKLIINFLKFIKEHEVFNQKTILNEKSLMTHFSLSREDLFYLLDYLLVKGYISGVYLTYFDQGSGIINFDRFQISECGEEFLHHNSFFQKFQRSCILIFVVINSILSLTSCIFAIIAANK